MLHIKNGCEDVTINNYIYIYNYLLIFTIHNQFINKTFVIKFVWLRK